MYLMAKNQDGTFLKLGPISVNLVGTIFDLRRDIVSTLSDDLKDKKFIMMKETLKDIDGPLEEKLSVTEVYSSECVLIRFVNETGKVWCYYKKDLSTLYDHMNELSVYYKDIEEGDLRLWISNMKIPPYEYYVEWQLKKQKHGRLCSFLLLSLAN